MSSRVILSKKIEEIYQTSDGAFEPWGYEQAASHSFYADAAMCAGSDPVEEVLEELRSEGLCYPRAELSRRSGTDGEGLVGSWVVAEVTPEAHAVLSAASCEALEEAGVIILSLEDPSREFIFRHVALVAEDSLEALEEFVTSNTTTEI